MGLPGLSFPTINNIGFLYLVVAEFEYQPVSCIFPILTIGRARHVREHRANGRFAANTSRALAKKNLKKI